jgi:hypothetical protein
MEEMRDTQISTEGRDYKIEVIAYLVISPQSGPHHQTFSDEDIQASGGIHALERVVEQESYWFVRLGQIRGELGEYGLTFHNSAIAALPTPSESDWRTGRRNPAFGKSELERVVFRSIYRAVERMLEGWKWVEDTTVNAYALKELRVSAQRLRGLTNALHSIRQVHDVARITVIKHWYDPTWSEPHLPTDDVVLAEYALDVPFLVGWSAGEELISARVMPISPC